MGNNKFREYRVCKCFQCKHCSSNKRNNILSQVKRSIRQQSNQKLKALGEDYELAELRGGIYLD